MSQGDVIGMVLSYVYAFGLLFAVEAIGKKLGWRQAFTRKIIHMGAGLWIWGILAFFDHWVYGIIPFGTFIILNYVFYRRQTFKAMDDERSTPGTIYFALSITVLFALLWRTGGQPDRVPIAAAAVMSMTIGDALASIVGMRWGRHRYAVLGHSRSWEGSAAMAGASLLCIWLTLLWVPGSALSPNSAIWGMGMSLAGAAIGAAAAAVAEGLSPAGTDNLSVPLLSGLALYLLSGLL